LIANGNFTRGFLGLAVHLNSLSVFDRFQFEQQQEQVFIQEVAKNSPAEKAGLLQGDQIIAIDGVKIHSGFDFMHYMYPLPPGAEIQLTIERQGEVLLFTVELESF
jgi:serine protease Do